MQRSEYTPSPSILAVIVDAVRRQPGLGELSIGHDSCLADLGINSLRLVRLILTLQKQLNAAPLAIDRVGEVRTVSDLSKLFDAPTGGSLARTSTP